MGVGPSATVELGYRPVSFLALMGEASFGVHSLSLPVEAEQGANVTTVGLFGGARVYPVSFGILEPWVGAMLGYHFYTERVARGAAPFDDESARQLRRIAARFQIGFDVALGDHVALGPFLDWDPELAGVECTKQGGGPAKCSKLHHPSSTDPPDAVAPSAQPQFMTIGVEVQWRP